MRHIVCLCFSGLMILLFFFTYLAFREARKNDQLIEQGREDEILERMQD